MTMKNAVPSSASAFQRRRSGGTNTAGLGAFSIHLSGIYPRFQSVAGT
jgi:hypothetical protein